MHKNIILILLLALLFFLCGCTQDTADMFNDHVIAMWAQTLEPYAVDIAFFGDSRVALADWEHAYPDSDVVNLGIGGDIVEGTIQRLALLEALDVKYCFLAIGVNNCAQRSYSAALFRRNYDTLLVGLEDLGITVYVNTIAGVTTDNSNIDSITIDRINTNVNGANAIIRELADTHDMELIEMADKMNNPDGSLKAEYSADGVHFSALGNQVWYDSLRTSVEGVL